ncbi:transcription termination/antitermination NusG family protein [Pseudomonas viridiflava]|uniref:transcription termination/antitermination NusG family protein n=1 Tax=Pseudomonas viridiflava TaxID=33069 RepID=UPI000F04F94C|nr:transcription termination/antitermination NusG family protein [Pseudomonas viridiflava]
MKHWYLLTHNSTYFNRITVEMMRMGVEFFSPSRTKLRKRPDRPSFIKSEHPLFPGYMFLKFDPWEVHTTQITAITGAHGFVRFAGDPCIVAEQVIDAMRSILILRFGSEVRSVQYRNLDTDVEQDLHKIMDLESAPARISAICKLIQEHSLSASHFVPQARKGVFRPSES